MVTGWDTLILLIITVGPRWALAEGPAAASPHAASAVLFPAACLLPHPRLGGVIFVALLLVVVAVTWRSMRKQRGDLISFEIYQKHGCLKYLPFLLKGFKTCFNNGNN